MPSRVAVPLAIASLVAVTATAAHVRLSGNRSHYTGLLLPLDHVFTLLTALALIVLCIALGRRLLRAGGLDFDNPLEGIPFAAAIGSATLGTLLLIMGSVGAVQGWALSALFGALALVAFADRAGLLTWLGRLGTTIEDNGISRGIPAIHGAFLLFVLVLALCPPGDWDALMYHLDVPAEYLRSGRLHLPVDNLHALLVGPIQLIYLPLLLVGTASGPAVLNAFFAGLLAMAVLAFATRFLSARAGSLASVALWGNTALVLVAASPRIDTTLCLFTFLAQWALLEAWQRPERRRFYILAAVLLGAGVGVKLHTLLFIIGLFPLIAWIPLRHRQPSGPKAPSGFAPYAPVLTFGLVGLACALPWLVRNYWLAGAPFYPAIGASLIPPWLAAIFGQSTVPAGIDPYVGEYIGLARNKFHLLDAFFAPHRITIEGEGVFYFASPLLLLAPLWMFAPRNAVRNWLAWGAGAYLVLLLVPFPHTNLRYILPAAPALTLVVIDTLLILLDRARRFERWLPANAFHQWLPVWVVVLSLLPTLMSVTMWVTRTGMVAHVVGGQSEQQYLSTHLLAVMRTVPELRALVHDAVPPESRVLLLFEARGFQIGTTVRQDNLGSTWPLLVESGTTRQCLGGLGITHVLVGTGSVDYYASRGVDLKRIHWTAFPSFAKRCLTAIGRTEHYALYRISPSVGDVQD